jgi:hypothetical protein
MLRVCTQFRPGMAACCADGGSASLLAALRREVARRGLDWTVEATCCLGHCTMGPNVKAAPGGPMLHRCRSVEDVLGRLPADWPPPPDPADRDGAGPAAEFGGPSSYPGG